MVISFCAVLFPRGVLDEILNLIGSVSEDFPSYSFEKAFDTPPHELLKCKVYGYGIGGKTLNWLDSFLCDRQQRGVVNGDWTPVL